MPTEDVQLDGDIFNLFEEQFKRIVSEADTVGSVDEETGCVKDYATSKGRLEGGSFRVWISSLTDTFHCPVKIQVLEGIW